jgi:hypothetical protein
MIKNLALVLSGIVVGILFGSLIAIAFAGGPLLEPSPMPPLADVIRRDSPDSRLADSLVDSLRTKDIAAIRDISNLTTEMEILLFENQGEILRSLFGTQPAMEFYGSVNLEDRERRSIWKLIDDESGNEALLSLWVADGTIRHFRSER